MLSIPRSIRTACRASQKRSSTRCIISDQSVICTLRYTILTLFGAYVVQKFLGSSWPEELGNEWRALSLDFQERAHDVALKILQALAISLGRPETFFDEVGLVDQSAVFHYPWHSLVYAHLVADPAAAI